MSRGEDRGLYWLLHVVGKSLSRVSSALTAGGDQARAQAVTGSLRRDVEEGWAAVLEREQGRVQERGRAVQRTHFDYAVCVVEFPGVEAQVSRGRGEVRVQVRAKPGGEWEELPVVLRRAGVRDRPEARDGVVAFGNAMLAHWDVVARWAQTGDVA